jgi:DNA-binding CsgD family transcriptional regulator
MDLTDREEEVLYLIAYEFPNREIAKTLFISVNTVDTYRRKLFIKFGAKNAAGLVRRAFEAEVMPMAKPNSIEE